MVSQPGVSRALARLEHEVGSPLLLRSGRILRTTHAGAVLKPHVDAALHSFDDGLAAVEQLIDPETGSVSSSSSCRWGLGWCRTSSTRSGATIPGCGSG